MKKCLYTAIASMCFFGLQAEETMTQTMAGNQELSEMFACPCRSPNPSPAPRELPPELTS